jgi:hypothetical protein
VAQYLWSNGKMQAKDLQKSLDIAGATPLQRAAEQGHHTVVKWLCEMGAEKEYEGRCSMTALVMASKVRAPTATARCSLSSCARSVVATGVRGGAGAGCAGSWKGQFDWL